MTFDLVAIWNHMGFANRLIAVSLIVMGLAYIVITVERIFVMARMKSKSAKYQAEVAPLLESMKLEQALALAKETKGSEVAGMTAAVLSGFTDKRPGTLDAIERAHRELELFKESFASQIRRGLPVVATVGSITPFVGLLGTVIGMIVAFQAIGAGGSAGMSTVMVGIAEALIETALGLGVAIPAVIAFNYLNTKIEKFEESLGQTAKRLMNTLEDFGGKA